MSVELDAAVTLRHDLVRIIRTSLGLPETVAVPMADHLARELCRSRLLTEWRNIPAAEAREAQRLAIARDYNGRNIEELMKKHGVSRATVYRAVQGSRRKSSQISAT